MSRLRDYVANTSWLAVERIIRMTLGLVGWLYIARYLGPDSYGLLNYALSFVGLFAAVAPLGVDVLLVRELVQRPEERSVLLGTGTMLRLAGSVSATVVITAIILLTNTNDLERALIWVISTTLILQSLGGIENYFAAEVRSRYVVYVQLLQSIISLIIRIILVQMHASLIWFAVAIVFDGIILGLGLLIIYSRFGGDLTSWRFRMGQARDLIKASWPIMFTGIFITIYLKVDQVMLKIMVGEHDTGIYAAAVKLSETWYFIPAIITASLFPAVLNARKVGREIYYKRLQKLYDLLTLLSVSLAIAITFISTPLITVIFGERFAAAGPVLALHIWAGVLVFGGFARQHWVLAENLQRKELWLSLTGAILNILFNYLLIPVYGAMGAALATLLSYTAGMYLMTWIIKDFRPYFHMYNTSFLHLVTLRTLREPVR